MVAAFFDARKSDLLKGFVTVRTKQINSPMHLLPLTNGFLYYKKKVKKWACIQTSQLWNANNKIFRLSAVTAKRKLALAVLLSHLSQCFNESLSTLTVLHTALLQTQDRITERLLISVRMLSITFYLARHLAVHIFGQGIFRGKHLCFFAYSSSAASLLDALSDLPGLITSKHNRTVSSTSEGHYSS